MRIGQELTIGESEDESVDVFLSGTKVLWDKEGTRKSKIYSERTSVARR